MLSRLVNNVSEYKSLIPLHDERIVQRTLFARLERVPYFRQDLGRYRGDALRWS